MLLRLKLLTSILQKVDLALTHPSLLTHPNPLLRREGVVLGQNLFAIIRDNSRLFSNSPHAISSNSPPSPHLRREGRSFRTKFICDHSRKFAATPIKTKKTPSRLRNGVSSLLFTKSNNYLNLRSIANSSSHQAASLSSVVSACQEASRQPLPGSQDRCSHFLQFQIGE